MASMDCIDALAFVHERLDGTLAPEQARQLAEHLDTCAACRLEEAHMRLFVCAETQRPLIDPGPEFTAQLMSRLQLQPRPVKFWKPAASLALLAGLLLTLNHLWLSGFSFSDLAGMAVALRQDVAHFLAGVYSGLSTLTWSAALATRQGSSWLLAIKSYLPLLLLGALILVILAQIRLVPARAGRRGE